VCVVSSFKISLAVIGVSISLKLGAARRARDSHSASCRTSVDAETILDVCRVETEKQMIKYGDYSTDGGSKQTQRIQVRY
jgi:hypothetical protein